jgi:two-component system sensor kinase FixL
MNDLVNILHTSRETICKALVEQLHRTDCPTLGGDATADGCRTVLEAIIAYRTDGNEFPAMAWAEAFHVEATRVGWACSHVLTALGCVERIIRFHVFKQFTDRKDLLVALNQLADAMDLLRRCYAEIRLDEQAPIGSAEHNDRQRALTAMKELAEESHDLICLATLQGKTFYLNHVGRRLVGLGEDEDVSAVSPRDYLSDESWAELRDVAAPAVKKTGRWDGRSRLLGRKSDKWVDVNTTMLLIDDPETGEPSCLAFVHRDRGRQDQIERDLAESDARKRAILESSLDPIITIDHEGVITEFNRAAEQVFGHPRDRVLGNPPSEILFPPAKIAGHKNRIDRYLCAGEGSMLGKRAEVTAVRANGETFPAELAMTINQQYGLPVLTFFVRDISERKRAEMEQARYAAELEHSNRELEQFAYVASHDLQEPLRKICSFGSRLEMQHGDSLDESGRDCLRRMQGAAVRMQTLIDDLLALSRVTTKGQTFVPVDLAVIAREVVSDLEVKIEQTDARVEVGKMPAIQADPVQMRQLLQNLIGNALKFHRDDEPPVVKVHARFIPDRNHRAAGQSPEDEQCRITVEDNGIGFNEKYLDRIFDVFQRLHPRDLYDGTGVGLAICRKIAERHGGTITAESTPGKGATFEVLLPAVHRKEH